MNLKIAVSEEDIKSGRRGNEMYCPLANAFRRAFPSAFKVWVSVSNDVQSGSHWHAHINGWKGGLRFDIRGEPADKASTFDHTGEMDPFEFEVSI